MAAHNDSLTDPALDPTSPYYLRPSDSQYKLVSENFNNGSA